MTLPLTQCLGCTVIISIEDEILFTKLVSLPFQKGLGRDSTSSFFDTHAPLNSEGKTSSNTYKWELEHLVSIFLLKFKFLLLISITISILQPDLGGQVQHSSANIACNEISGDTHRFTPLSNYPQMYCWRNGLITRIPQLQEFGWTHDGEGTLCAPALPVTTYSPIVLYRNVLRPPWRRTYKTCSRRSSLQASIQFSFIRSMPACTHPAVLPQTANTDGFWLQIHLYNQRAASALWECQRDVPFPKTALASQKQTQFPHIREILFIYPVC